MIVENDYVVRDFDPCTGRLRLRDFGRDWTRDFKLLHTTTSSITLYVTLVFRTQAPSSDSDRLRDSELQIEVSRTFRA